MPGSQTALKRESDAEFMARVKPALNDIEAFRHKKCASWHLRRIVAIILSIPVALIGLILELAVTHYFGLDDDLPCFFFLGVIALWAWALAPKGEYQKLYKETVVPKIAEALGLSLYDPKGAIPLTDIAAAKMLPRMEDYAPEDYFEGSYEGARIRFSRAVFEQKEEEFAGIILLIDLPGLSFRGHAVVRQKDAPGAAGGKYDVHADDPDEAAALRSPEMTAQIDALAQAYTSDDISIVFFRSQIFAMIACDKDYFEPDDISAPTTVLIGALEIKKETDQILALIDAVTR